MPCVWEVDNIDMVPYGSTSVAMHTYECNNPDPNCAGDCRACPDYQEAPGKYDEDERV